jgi:glutamate racemase
MPVDRPAVPRIGVFDSGVGGLSVYEQIRRRLPGAHYVYCSDNLNYPYGTKTEAEVVAAVRRAVGLVDAKYPLDLIVVACNTASTLVLPFLRSEFAVPVVGVVPAVKPAAAASTSKIIGLLATPGTVRRPYTDELVQSFASQCQVIRVGSKLLIDAAEAKLRGEALDDDSLATEIAPFFAAGGAGGRLDIVVLGCTHFPLLRPELERLAPWPVQWIDSGDAVAQRVRQLFGEQGPQALDVIAAAEPTRGVAVFTKNAPDVARLGAALKAYMLGEPEFL